MADHAEGGDREHVALDAYRRRLLGVRGAFEAGARWKAAGLAAITGRSEAMDELVESLCQSETIGERPFMENIAIVAVGGYGRNELFPCSDVDLLFLLEAKLPEREVKEAIRRVNQRVWDAGARASPITRTLAECDHFDAENVEGMLALLDARLVCGSGKLFGKLRDATAKVVARDGRTIMVKLAELARARHAKYGATLFHLEPNIKDCPGGLRDVHLWGWMRSLHVGREKRTAGASGALDAELSDEEFRESASFLATIRCFLHYRRERDDNTLDWQVQDEAAELGLGSLRQPETTRQEQTRQQPDAAYWMRIYFRHARIVNRRAMQALQEVPARRGLLAPLRPRAALTGRGFRVEQGRAVLAPALPGQEDPAVEPHIVLGLFAEMARVGFTPARETEDRLTNALPSLSAHLEEGPALWHGLSAILKGTFAGDALRTMHALGLLELLLPEFHGIDALVVRDAYHRYTVDEHTFVLIDTLHGLRAPRTGPAEEWALTFARLLEDMAHPELLFLAALMHDTGKGRSSGLHAVESERMTRSVAARLELGGRETELVAGLVRHHLEMSAALRRDIFDAETIKGFAAKVANAEMLRMLTLFTYADINAVHPDALTPWKAENLWRLYMATANALDRSVDEERVNVRIGGELVHRVLALVPARQAEVEAYLEGFPERYLRTRTAEQIGLHFEMAANFAIDPVQLDFQYAPSICEITLVTRDRELLFASMTGVLTAWGMNIVTADAFSNARGIVVDSFRFTDSFRTLEMNESERGAFVHSVKSVLAGSESVEKLLAARRRGRRKAPKMPVRTRVDFDRTASSHSTLVQVVTQDSPGLLRTLSLVFAGHQCSVEVALVDTEGEAAIDVFYLTKNGAKLNETMEARIKQSLLEAIEAKVL